MKKYSGQNALSFLINLIKKDLNKKLSFTDIENTLTSNDIHKVLSANQGRLLNENIEYIKFQKGMPNGLAPLNDSGKIAARYLPSYIDDIVEGYMGTDINGENQTFYIIQTNANGETESVAVTPNTSTIYANTIVPSSRDDDKDQDLDIASLIQTKQRGLSSIEDFNVNFYRWTGKRYIAILMDDDIVECTNDEIDEIWDSVFNAITFNIKNNTELITINAVENITWGNWITSNYYNNGSCGYSIKKDLNTDYIHFRELHTTDTYLLTYNGANVTINESIIKDATYEIILIGSILE